MVDFAPNFYQSWGYLEQGQVLQAVLSVHTWLLGDFFYALLVFSGMGVMYLKTESMLPVTTSGALLSGFVVVLVPVETQFFLVMAVALGLASILYKAFW